MKKQAFQDKISWSTFYSDKLKINSTRLQLIEENVKANGKEIYIYISFYRDIDFFRVYGSKAGSIKN